MGNEPKSAFVLELGGCRDDKHEKLTRLVSYAYEC